MKPLSVPPNVQMGLTPTASGRNTRIVLGSEIALRTGRIHEVAGDAADMIAVRSAACTKGPVIWIAPHRAIGTLAPTGIQDFIDPQRLILIGIVSRDEALWAAEQALQTCSGAAVIAELWNGPDLRESRRLQIAAETAGSIGVLLITGEARNSAAETRWQASSLAEGGWRWSCEKDKRGPGGAWEVHWQGDRNGPDAVHMAAAPAA